MAFWQIYLANSSKKLYFVDVTYKGKMGNQELNQLGLESGSLERAGSAPSMEGAPVGRVRTALAVLALLVSAGCTPGTQQKGSADAAGFTPDAYSELDASPEAQKMFRVSLALLENSEGVHGINIYGSADDPMVFDVVVENSGGDVVAEAAEGVLVDDPIFDTVANLDTVLGDDTGDLLVRIIGTNQNTGEVQEETVDFTFDDEGVPDKPE